MRLNFTHRNVTQWAPAGRSCRYGLPPPGRNTCLTWLHLSYPRSLTTVSFKPFLAHNGSEMGHFPRGAPHFVAKATQGGADNTDAALGAAMDSPFVVSINTLKASLLQAIFSTARGLEANSGDQAKINELINQLEVKGGQGADVSSAEFGGTWELLYTNATDLLALLSVSKLPLSPIKIGTITQTIDASSGTLENSVQLEFPLVQTSLSTVSNYNIASPKRLQFTVQRGILHTPSIEGNLEFPASVTFMGQTLDLVPLRDVLAPITRGAVSFAESALGQAPNLEVPLQTQTWQLTTYLDPILRITRGDGGAVYVFKRTEATSTKKA